MICHMCGTSSSYFTEEIKFYNWNIESVNSLEKKYVPKSVLTHNSKQWYEVRGWFESFDETD